MDIYILRHGAAEPRANDVPDRDRKLTLKGKRDVQAVAKAALHAKAKPTVIFTSPLVRAKETAAIAAKVLGCGKVIETRSLMPGARPDLIWKELGSHAAIPQVNAAVMLAGHEPHMSRIVAFLLEAAVVVDFKKGALVRISTTGKIGPPRGVLKWAITPRLAGAGR